MWLRLGKRSLWHDRSSEDDGHVEAAAEDLRPRENSVHPGEYEDVSVYQVADKVEAERVAAAHAICYWKKPGDIDAILLPEEAVSQANLEAVPRPAPDIPEYLRTKHFEILGLQDEGSRLMMVRLSLASDALSAERVRKARIKTLCREGLRDAPGIRDSTRPDWCEYLEAAKPDADAT